MNIKKEILLCCLLSIVGSKSTQGSGSLDPEKCRVITRYSLTYPEMVEICSILNKNGHDHTISPKALAQNHGGGNQQDAKKACDQLMTVQEGSDGKFNALSIIKDQDIIFNILTSGPRKSIFGFVKDTKDILGTPTVIEGLGTIRGALVQVPTNNTLTDIGTVKTLTEGNNPSPVLETGLRGLLVEFNGFLASPQNDIKSTILPLRTRIQSLNDTITTLNNEITNSRGVTGGSETTLLQAVSQRKTEGNAIISRLTGGQQKGNLRDILVELVRLLFSPALSLDELKKIREETEKDVNLQSLSPEGLLKQWVLEDESNLNPTH